MATKRQKSARHVDGRSGPAEPTSADADAPDSPAPDSPAPVPPGLGQLGLEVGDRVRFRRAAGQHWQEAAVEGRERDGSVTLRDSKGASRCIRPELLEVCRVTRGVTRWEPVTERDWEQLSLFSPEMEAATAPPRRRRRST